MAALHCMQPVMRMGMTGHKVQGATATQLALPGVVVVVADPGGGNNHANRGKRGHPCSACQLVHEGSVI